MAHSRNKGPWLPIGPFREWLLEEVEGRGRAQLALDLGVQYKQLSRWLETNKWVPMSVVEDVMWARHEASWSDIYKESDLVTIRKAINGGVQMAEEGRFRVPLLSSNYSASRDSDDRRTGGVTKDVAFNRKSFDGGEIKSPSDNGRIQVGTDGITVKLIQGIDEPNFRRTLGMAQMATRGVDLETWTEGETDWEEMLKGGLQTALESQVIVFAVSGVSRAETHQAVRSRRAAFHQQSMRAHWYGDRPEFRCPESVWAAGGEVLETWTEAVEAAHFAYNTACDAGVSYQDARYILPEGTTNFILHEYPVREFLNVYAYRACSMFQWEIVAVMREMKRVLVEAHPWLEPYVKISCEKTRGALDEYHGVLPGSPETEATAHHCTFQGWEQVDGQCDFPWARETNRAFVSKMHAIVNKAKVKS